jgi:hypothetical protein
MVVAIGFVIRAITHGGAKKAEVGYSAAGAALFDPFPDEPPAGGEPIRDDVLRRHREWMRNLADATEGFVPLYHALEGPPDGATLADKQALEARVAQLKADRGSLTPSNAAEEDRLLAEFAVRLIDIGIRQQSEIRRLLAKRPGGPFTDELRRQMTGIDQALAGLRKGLTRRAGAVPCVDVLLADFVDTDGLVGDAIRTRLEAMADSGLAEVFQLRTKGGLASGRSAIGVRLGPVADPQAFSRKIAFGRVESVKGRKVHVVDVHADPSELNQARAARGER